MNLKRMNACNATGLSRRLATLIAPLSAMIALAHIDLAQAQSPAAPSSERSEPHRNASDVVRPQGDADRTGSSDMKATSSTPRKLELKGFAFPMTRNQVMSLQEGRQVLECRADPQDVLVEVCHSNFVRNGNMCAWVLKPPSKIREHNCAPAPTGLQPLATYAGHQIHEVHFRFFDGQLLRISVFPSINRLQQMEIVRLISEKYGAPDEEEGESRRWREPGDRTLLVGPGVIEIANVPLYEAKKARWAAGEAARQQEVAKKVAADQAASSKRKADF